MQCMLALDVFTRFFKTGSTLKFGSSKEGRGIEIENGEMMFDKLKL